MKNEDLEKTPRCGFNSFCFQFLLVKDFAQQGREGSKCTFFFSGGSNVFCGKTDKKMQKNSKKNLKTRRRQEEVFH